MLENALASNPVAITLIPREMNPEFDVMFPLNSVHACVILYEFARSMSIH